MKVLLKLLLRSLNVFPNLLKVKILLFVLGPLYPTERHFFTADNQLLIIVKVKIKLVYFFVYEEKLWICVNFHFLVPFILNAFFNRWFIS